MKSKHTCLPSNQRRIEHQLPLAQDAVISAAKTSLRGFSVGGDFLGSYSPSNF